MTDLKEIKDFIESHVSKIKPLSKKCRLAYWNATTTGDEEFYKEYEKLQKDMEKIFNDRDSFERLKEFNKLKIEDPLIKRQVEILYRQYLGSQGELGLLNQIIEKSTEIEKKFNIFRTEINGKKLSDNEIKTILKTETNSEKLREAWEASKKQGKLVERDLIELIKLRNKLARQLGFSDYYTFSLELSEQKKEDIEKIFNDLDKLTKQEFRKLKEEIDLFLSKKYRILKDELKPWHYQDLFFQEAPQILEINLDQFYSDDILEKAKEFYNDINLSADSILEKGDLYEKEGKYQHAYCIDIDKEGDIRTLMNIRNNEKEMETVLHELGHGIYWKFINKDLPYVLRGPAHIFTTEAIAQLFGRQSKNASFIERYCNVKKEELKTITKAIRKMLKLRQLVFSRWSQVMINFEKKLYENPEQDLNILWWDLVKKFQLLNFSRNEPDWASKIHLVSVPVYYHNYLLGELLASQLTNYLAKNIIKTDSLYNLDYFSNKGVGEYLKKSIFSPGKTCCWQEFVEKTTGEVLNPAYYAKEFVE